MSFVLGTLLLVISLLYVLFKRSYFAFLSRNIPYIPGSFPFGSSVDTFTKRRHLGIVFQEFYHKLKPHKIGAVFLLHKPAFLTCHPEVIRDVMSKDFDHFFNRGIVVNLDVDPLSRHLLNLENEEWRELRKKLTHVFTSAKLKGMQALMERCSENLVKEMRRRSFGVDLKEYFARYTTDVIGSCAFGLDFNSFDEEHNEFRRYGAKIFRPSFQAAFTRVVGFSFPRLLKLLRLKSIDKNVEDFFMRAVKETVAERRRKEIIRNDFLRLMMDIQDKEGMRIEDVAAQCFVFFFAGFETSSTLGTFCLYELAKNQEIQEKVREEVRRSNALEEMKYLNCVLEETLRKHPPAMFLARKCNKDWTKYGVTVKVGETVFIPVYAFQHDEEYFPNPEEFIPERFNEANKSKIVPYTYLPFGEGPRNCIGMRFGMMQTKVGVAALVDKFRFKLNEKSKGPVDIDKRNIIYSSSKPLLFDVEEL